MRITTLLAFALTSSLITQVVTQTPDGLIVPFAQLPLCAATCGKLWDIQGSCAPAAPVTDAGKQCFCSSPDLVPFTVGGPAGDCCAAGAPQDLQLVKNWFTGYCKDVKKAAPAAQGTPTTEGAPATTVKATGTSTADAKPVVKDNRTWIQSHYQWIIMAVILLIAFIGSWVLAAFLRRRHLRKRSQNFELNPPHQPWVGNRDSTMPFAGTGVVEYNAGGGGGVFGKEEEARGVAGGKKKKWIVHERT